MLKFISRRATNGTVDTSKPNSARAAGAGGSSNTMLKLYTDDSPGLRVCVPIDIIYC
jgi:protein transport protein SEC61 subunit beta